MARTARFGLSRERLLARLTTVAMVALIALAGCSASDPTKDDASDTDALSNRPQQYDRFIAILRLSNPPLLQTASRSNGQVSVDSVLKQKILDEQAAVIEDLTSRHAGVQVLAKYHFTLNAITIVAPIALKDEFKNLASVSYVESSQAFGRAVVMRRDGGGAIPAGIGDQNSATHIGANRVRAELKVPGPNGGLISVAGRGVKIGIIDTGIDYTHKMFGGAGTRSAYLANNPKSVEAGSFPTSKVRGGIDLVGAKYDSNSPRFSDHLPSPDADPLDVQGHGTHVAGTAAGQGDNVKTHDGVAPEAELYAIKVFGDVSYGSTADHVVISAFEYAIDPNGDLNPTDKLDVVNLSLGSSFGTAHVLYEESLGQLMRGGDVVVVCSAGNSGDYAYIVGAPSTAKEAISVAASIDKAAGGDSLQDTLTSFSSRGPRSIDGLFKPEVAAPGYNIISAGVGRGDEGVKMSGTSMSSPHVAGMMALLRQVHPTWSALELKSLAVNTAKSIKDQSGSVYPLSRQGAGRVQAYEAATGTVLLSPSTISLGITRSRISGTRSANVTVTNRDNVAQTLQLSYTGSTGMSVSGPQTLSLTAGESKVLTLSFTIDPRTLASGQDTLEAVVTLARQDGTPAARLPALALAQYHSSITFDHTAGGAGTTSVELANATAGSGGVEAFVSLGKDEPLVVDPANPFRDDACDLESAGFRTVTRRVNGVDKTMLQVGVNLHKRISTWHLCEVSIQIDKQGDGTPEQELLGTFLSTLSDNFDDGDGRFLSLLMDWKKMVERRRTYEQDYDPSVRPTLDYVTPALVGNRPFVGVSHGSLAIVEADLANVARANDGSFYVKVATLALAGTGPSNDDFLGDGQGFWVKVKPEDGKLGTDASIKLNAGQTKTVTLSAPTSDLTLYFPQNEGPSAAPRAVHLGE